MNLKLEMESMYSSYFGWAVSHLFHLLLVLFQLKLQLSYLLFYRVSSAVNLCIIHKQQCKHKPHVQTCSARQTEVVINSSHSRTKPA